MSNLTRDRGADLRLNGLARSYGDNRVVDHVDLAVNGGEIVALLGPSGCGKTTTLRMIAGLIEPSGGDILIDGKPVAGLPVHKRDLGMLFQDYALFPHLSVYDNVAFGLAMRKLGREETRVRVREALRLVRLSDYEDRMPGELSGGQQQRVALARAIVYRPRILLLDEPLGALDKKLREAMQSELRQLCRDLNLTTILVTHDQEEALLIADKIAVMRGGRIEQFGSARDIYEHPSTQFVADFIGTSNFMPAGITAEEGGRVILSGPGGLVLHAVGPSRLAVGERAMVAVRPESVTLSPGASASVPNAIAGPVRQAVFKGSHLTVSLAMPQGEDFLCIVPVDSARIPEPGEIWTAGWPVERTLIVREQ